MALSGAFAGLPLPAESAPLAALGEVNRVLVESMQQRVATAPCTGTP